MKAVVMAMYAFAAGFSQILGFILTPVTKDPYLIWAWAGPGIALVLQTGVFWWKYRFVNEEEFMTRGTGEEGEAWLGQEKESKSVGRRIVAPHDRDAG